MRYEAAGQTAAARPRGRARDVGRAAPSGQTPSGRSGKSRHGRAAWSTGKVDFAIRICDSSYGRGQPRRVVTAEVDATALLPQTECPRIGTSARTKGGGSAAVRLSWITGTLERGARTAPPEAASRLLANSPSRSDRADLMPRPSGDHVGDERVRRRLGAQRPQSDSPRGSSAGCQRRVTQQCELPALEGRRRREAKFGLISASNAVLGDPSISGGAPRHGAGPTSLRRSRATPGGETGTRPRAAHAGGTASSGSRTTSSGFLGVRWLDYAA